VVLKQYVEVSCSSDKPKDGHCKFADASIYLSIERRTFRLARKENGQDPWLVRYVVFGCSGAKENTSGAARSSVLKFLQLQIPSQAHAVWSSVKEIVDAARGTWGHCMISGEQETQYKELNDWHIPIIAIV